MTIEQTKNESRTVWQPNEYHPDPLVNAVLNVAAATRAQVDEIHQLSLCVVDANDELRETIGDLTATFDERFSIATKAIKKSVGTKIADALGDVADIIAYKGSPSDPDASGRGDRGGLENASGAVARAILAISEVQLKRIADERARTSEEPATP
jgi:hypothetical protein